MKTTSPKSVARLRTACASSLLLPWLLALPSAAQVPFDYTTNNGAITITGYTGSGDSVSIPSTISGLPVTSIGAGAFYGDDSLTSVTIPGSVTNLGENALRACFNLTTVGFLGDAPTVDPSAFMSDSANVYYVAGSTGWGPTLGGLPTSLWDPLVPAAYTNNAGTITITRYLGSGGPVTVPGTINGVPVTSIGTYYATQHTAITVTIGEFAAFLDASLTSVTIPSSVTNIPGGSFTGCANLSAITVDPANPAYNSVAGVLFDKSQTTLTQYPGGKSGSYTIPDGVTSIDGGAFGSCSNLTGVTIPSGVTNLGNGAFAECASLTNLTIPNTVTRIGLSAFFGCINLTAITIPNGVTSLGGSAFGACFNLTNVTIPGSVASIGGEAFLGCTKLTSVTIGDGVTSIGNEAFYEDTGLTSLTIPKTVTSIGDFAFALSGLSAVYFEGNAPSLGMMVFMPDSRATVYYLPGTTGWGATFGGRPTVLWNPQVQTSDGSFGVRGNQFGFTVTGASNLVVVVEASTNLASPTWIPLQTNTLTGGSARFSDLQWTSCPSRFYRLRWP